MSPIRVGVDFGGSKIEAAVLDADGCFLARRRIANPGGYDAAIAATVALIDDVERQAGARGTVGVGAPGSVSPATGVIRNANSTWLNGRCFREDLEARLGRKVRLANDANCLALSETVDGAAAGAKSAFAIILGTGCGGGLVIDGRLVEGASGIAGEWGHTPLPWPSAGETPGPECWCGQRGCLETWISGSGLARDHRARTGIAIAGPEIVARAQAGEPAAAATLDRYVDRLGRALAVICDIVDPEVIVFGGGMSNLAALYERLPDVISRRVFADAWLGRLAPARWGDASGVRGAARLWDETDPV